MKKSEVKKGMKVVPSKKLGSIEEFKDWKNREDSKIVMEFSKKGFLKVLKINYKIYNSGKLCCTLGINKDAGGDFFYPSDFREYHKDITWNELQKESPKFAGFFRMHPGTWQKFVANFDPDFIHYDNCETIRDYLKFYDLKEYLHYAFNWGDTPEGVLFWYKLSKLLENYNPE